MCIGFWKQGFGNGGGCWGGFCEKIPTTTSVLNRTCSSWPQNGPTAGHIRAPCPWVGCLWETVFNKTLKNAVQQLRERREKKNPNQQINRCEKQPCRHKSQCRKRGRRCSRADHSEVGCVPAAHGEDDSEHIVSAA